MDGSIRLSLIYPFTLVPIFFLDIHYICFDGGVGVPLVCYSSFLNVTFAHTYYFLDRFSLSWYLTVAFTAKLSGSFCLVFFVVLQV